MGSRVASKSCMIMVGRTVRPCGMYGTERARSYCAADEACLCDRCDASVHLVNLLARHHGRVRIRFNDAPVKINRLLPAKTDEAPSRSRDDEVDRSVRSKCRYRCLRKRTRVAYPRLIGHSEIQDSLLPEEASAKEVESSIAKPNQEVSTPPQMGLKSDSQLPQSELSKSICNIKAELTDHRTTNNFCDGLSACPPEDTDFAQEVPIFEPLLQDLISTGHGDLMENLLPTKPSLRNDATFSANQEIKADRQVDLFLDSESGLCEVEGDDMSSMIEEGSISIDDASGVDAMGVMDYCASSNLNLNQTDELDLQILDMWRSHMDYSSWNGKQTSVLGPSPFKTRGERQLEPENVKLEQDTYPIHFSYANPFEKMETTIESRKTFYRALSLRLNYEDVLSAWSDRGPLWIDGYRREIAPDDAILNESFREAGIVPDLYSPSCPELGQQAGHELHEVPTIDRSVAEREARVLRYREKRRTRLFCKKIRYEVRKLNAEKRPRMKGRFVKRSSTGMPVHEFQQ